MKFTRYPKRDAIRDYFPLPNEIFSLGLSTGEIAVYAYLMYCEDRKTFSMPSELQDDWQGGQHEQKYRQEICGQPD